MTTSLRVPRIYTTEDGQSHFDDVAVATRALQVHPGAAVFHTTEKLNALAIRITCIPANTGQVDWHTVPEPVLTVRLNGRAEYQTSDGDKRQVPAGGFILLEDTHGRGHRTIHSPHEQTVLWISMPNGFDV